MKKVYKVVEVTIHDDGALTVRPPLCEAESLAELCNAIEMFVFRESEAKRKAAVEKHGTDNLQGVFTFGELFPKLAPPPESDDDDDSTDDDTDVWTPHIAGGQ